MMCGGAKEASDPSDAGRAAVLAVKPQVEEKTGKKYTKFEPVSERTQVVAGTNYFVKVQADGDEFLHLRIYKDLSGNVTLSGVKHGLAEADVLEYFEQN